MLNRNQIAIYFTILASMFAFLGFFLITNTEESVTAAAISQINKVIIGSESETEIITEEILLKKDTGSATTIPTSVVSTIPDQTTSTIISTLSSVPSTSIIITTSTSVLTTSILAEQPTVYNLIPVSAVDNYNIDQVLPDGGPTDGTVELSNDDVRWLTVNGEYIQVDSWDNTIISNPFISSALVSCEIDWVNSKSGFVEFSYDDGSGWSSYFCSQEASEHTTYTCDLKQHGLDSASKINNVKIRCKMRNNLQGSVGFAVDSIKLDVITQ